MLDILTAAEFEPLLGQSLSLEFGNDTHALELAEVRAIQNPSPRAAPFALLLRGPRDNALPQGMYRLHHPAHGAIDLFMVPLGPDARGLCYEIIFN